MSHYAKLATLGFRWLGVGILFYSLPAVLAMTFMFRGMPMMGRNVPWMMPFAALLHPILAVIFIISARPLGEFAARGIE